MFAPFITEFINDMSKIPSVNTAQVTTNESKIRLIALFVLLLSEQKVPL